MRVVAVAYGLWIVFLISWYLAMLWTAKATVKGAAWKRLAYFAGFFVSFGLLFTPPRGARGFEHLQGVGSGLAGGSARLWRDPPPVGWALVAALVVAFAFAWWARIHIGRLWSGMLTLREGHKVIDTGPYRLARHPIYTGFIGAAWALALIVATPTALAGAAVLTVVMVTKAREEERFLRRELGGADYDAYAARTPMLLPFPRGGR